MNNRKFRMGFGSSHGKIILIGEHSVVYGYPAISLPLRNVKVFCKVMTSEEILEYNIEDPMSVAYYETLKYLKKDKYNNLKYKIFSQIPSKRGMGSSAAVSIALIRGIFDYFNEKLTYRTLNYLVDKSERIAHGNPSGLDAMTCMSNRGIKYIKNKGFSKIDLKTGGYLIIADTGIYGKTREAVEKVGNLKELKDKHMEKLGLLAKEIEENIYKKDLKKMGENMTLAHGELKELKVSCEKSDLLVEVALENGALGAKMTGGGLGGCIIALGNSWKRAKLIEKKLREKGAVQVWIEKI